MLSFEKVLEVFGDYLAQDKACEVLTTSRGIMVVDWESCKNNWVTSQLCPTPKKLLSVLRPSYEEYQQTNNTRPHEKLCCFFRTPICVRPRL